MTKADLRNYRAVNRKPTHVGYRGYDVYGMAAVVQRRHRPSARRSTSWSATTSPAATRPRLHHYLEASRAGLRRPRRVRRRPDVRRRAARRAARRRLRRRARLQDQRDHGARQAGRGRQPRVVRRRCATAAAGARSRDADTENISTTNLTVADRWGNVVEYTLTIEQTGGSGMVVPGRGFLLNNELTDFTTVYAASRPQPHPARQAAALLDVADDRAQGRRALAGARLARRLDDHHHGAADAVQPHRPRDDDPAGDRRPAGRPAQHARR